MTGFDYQKFVESRQPKFEDEGIKCLCCRDTGRLPDTTVKRYLTEVMPEIVSMYEHPLMSSSAPVLECTRQGCDAGMVKVEIQAKQGNGGDDGFGEVTVTKRVRRFGYGTQTLSPSMCQWIHDQELERIRMMEPQAPISPLRVRAAIAAGINAVPVMPALPKAEAFPIVEEEGLRVGDRVRLDISQLDPQTQKDIRRDNDLPRLGQECTVVRLERKTAINVERLWVTVRFDDGEEIPVLPSYLAHVQEVAA